MRNGPFTLIVCLAANAIALADFNPDPSWEGMIARLRESDTICCSLIGYAHTPSEQYALYQEVMVRGNIAQFKELLKDEHAVIRCVGLLALTKKDGAKSVATLKACLSDRDFIHFQAYDIISSMTVGGFAMALLRDTNYLVASPLTPNYQHTAAPLLSENELVCLEMKVLASDLATDLHDVAAYERTQAKNAGEFALDLAALRQIASLLKDYEIIKGVGRLRPSDDQRTFLVKCLHRADLDANARLAAASALTRRVDNAACESLQMERDALNRLGGRPWGSCFIEMLDARKAFDARMEPVRADRSWREQEKIKDKVIRAFTSDHPLALDDLLDNPAPVLLREHADVRQALADSLVAISANLEEVNQPWNTYSNTAVKLDLLIRGLRFHRESERQWMERELARSQQKQAETQQLLTEEDCTRIEKNIAGFLKESSK